MAPILAAASGVVYSYAVRASNICGEGPLSNADSGSIPNLQDSLLLRFPQNGSQILIDTLHNYEMPFVWDWPADYDSCKFICSDSINLNPPDTSLIFIERIDTLKVRMEPGNYYWTVFTYLCANTSYYDTFFIGMTTDVASSDSHVPTSFSLSQSYPNPFNPTATIEYSLPKPVHVILWIYDLLGRRIETPIDEDQSAGYHQVTWNSGNSPSGVYFYRIQAGNFTETKRMMLLK